jgi:4-amino-4-deoxy-L-arabinose transferase-like glycosyltransferase
MGAILLVVTIRARRTDRERAALLLWGGSLVSIGLVISLAQGIIHPYYTVALAPPLGALVGISTMGLWQRRASWVGRVGLAAGLAATVWWSYVLLGRTSDWFPALRPFVAVVGALGVVAILALPLLQRLPKVAVALVATLGFGAALAAPLFSTVATAATAHNGAIPSVTPTAQGGFGGPGGGGFPGGGGGFPGGAAGARRAFAGGFPGGTQGGGFPGGGTFPGAGSARNGTGTGGFPGGAFRRGGFGGGGGGGAGGAGGGGGAGFLSSSQSNAALNKALQADASRYTWAAATVNSNNAAGYQLGSGEPVMAIGGFNGTDPAPTLAQFEKYVAEGKVHYFISSGGGGFGGGGGGFGGGAGGFGGGGATSGSTSSDASQITSWVESHFTSQTIGGVTVYDLSGGASS